MNQRVLLNRMELYRLKNGNIFWQGLQEGTYTIEPQVFTYFDTKTRTIKNLKTKSLKLTIIPAAVTHTEQTTTGESTEKQTSSSPDREKDRSFAEISFILFLLLFLLPPSIILLRFLFPFILQPFSKIYTTWQRYRALNHASYLIEKACKAHDMTIVFSIMKQALMDYYALEIRMKI